jgi:hypothetical protein
MLISTNTSADGSESLGWGKCYGDIDETAELVLAWLWQWCSYERMDIHRAINGELVRQTNATECSRSQNVEAEFKIAPAIKNRKSKTRYSWFKIEEAGEPTQRWNYAIVFEPASSTRDVADAQTGFTKGSVEATSNGLFLLEKVAPRITKMIMLQKADLRGSIPVWLMNLGTTFVLSLVTHVQDKFRRVDRVVDKVRTREVLRSLLLLSHFTNSRCPLTFVRKCALP